MLNDVGLESSPGLKGTSLSKAEHFSYFYGSSTSALFYAMLVTDGNQKIAKQDPIPPKILEILPMCG